MDLMGLQYLRYYMRLTGQASPLIFLAIAQVLLTGCVNFRSVEEEIPVRFVPAASERAKLAVVFLPGRGDSMDAFVDAGFLDDLKEAGVEADAWMVDAHLGYYRSQTLDEKMRRAVFEKIAGYEEVWVVGVSLGALGAVLLEAGESERWDHMILLGPYVGDGKGFFRRSGVADATRQAIDSAVGPEHLRLFWNWMIAYSGGGGERPELWAAWGESDRFSDYQEYLRAYIADERLITVPGGHDWQSWREAWQLVLGDLTHATAIEP